MPLSIIQGDITTLAVDAIVNAANKSLLGGGGVDGAIHLAAGPRLLEECRTLNGCATGDAKITGGYNLPARHVIHTVGPIWQGGRNGEDILLRSAYRRSLETAVEHGLESIAFPLISAGVYGYPREKALQVAVSEIDAFLEEHDLMVYLVIYKKSAFPVSRHMIRSIKSYLEANFETDLLESDHLEPSFRAMEFRNQVPAEESRQYQATIKREAIRNLSLEAFLSDKEETFSQRLLHLIDSRGYTDVQAYKQANVDRKLFSKIRSNPDYQPSKATALAFAIALKLDLGETERLLKTAGYALSSSSRSDLIIEYFIGKGDYDIHTINEALFYFEEELLGA